MRRGATTALLLACGCAVGAARPALAQEAAPSATGGLQPPTAPTRLNPTGRDITLQSPLRDGPFILGEIDFVLGADDSLRVNAQRLLALLTPALEPVQAEALATALAGKSFVTAAELAPLGYDLRYDPETIGVTIGIPAQARTTRELRLRRFDEEYVGDFEEPATLSGYVNFRTFTDINWDGPDSGLRAPNALIDSAIRYRGFVLENEATLRLSGGGRTFIREGSRIVYDDRERLARWTLGDLRTVSRGFSSSPQMAGVSVVRQYSVLEPQRNVQPRGDRTFTLTRPSTVEAFVNGQSVRRIRLEPGSYNVRDFPFVQGSNNVRLLIEDDAGGVETLEFSLFFDRTLLAEGLTEFGLFAGFESNFNDGVRSYDLDEPVASGFFRRGVTDALTAGANFSASRRGALIGGEVVAATRFGTLGGDLAASYVDGIGSGYAFNLSLLRDWGGRGGGTGRSVSFGVEHRSRNFANPTEDFVDNRFAWDLTATYAQSLGARQFISLTGQYSIGRGTFTNEKSARLQYGLQINDRINLTVEGIYEDRQLFGEEYGVRVRLTFRLGRRSSAQAEYDSRFERGRLSYQTSRGEGVGSWTASADADIGEDNVGFNGNATYLANRAELGFSHATSFDISGSSIESQRSSFRLGTALVFADGNLALSRPIFDSFAMVRPHSSLEGAPVYVDPREDSYTARSGVFGPAVEPNLAAFSERVITFDVPTAPAGYDLGRGNARLFPPYRSGYLITAGSEYSVTAVGTLLGANGQPVSLLAGRAIELDAPDRAPVTVFTNRTGRFGITGLRPGRWRIEMPTEPAQSVIIEVPAGERGVLRLGNVQLGEGQ